MTARQEFEIQNGYYACGINGCILAERHTGVCVMPELPNQTRVRRSSSKGETEGVASSAAKDAAIFSDASKPPSPPSNVRPAKHVGAKPPPPPAVDTSGPAKQRHKRLKEQGEEGSSPRERDRSPSGRRPRRDVRGPERLGVNDGWSGVTARDWTSSPANLQTEHGAHSPPPRIRVVLKGERMLEKKGSPPKMSLSSPLVAAVSKDAVVSDGLAARKQLLSEQRKAQAAERKALAKKARKAARKAAKQAAAALGTDETATSTHPLAHRAQELAPEGQPPLLSPPRHGRGNPNPSTTINSEDEHDAALAILGIGRSPPHAPAASTSTRVSPLAIEPPPVHPSDADVEAMIEDDVGEESSGGESEEEEDDDNAPNDDDATGTPQAKFSAVRERPAAMVMADAAVAAPSAEPPAFAAAMHAQQYVYSTQQHPHGMPPGAMQPGAMQPGMVYYYQPNGMMMMTTDAQQQAAQAAQAQHHAAQQAAAAQHQQQQAAAHAAAYRRDALIHAQRNKHGVHHAQPSMAHLGQAPSNEELASPSAAEHVAPATATTTSTVTAAAPTTAGAGGAAARRVVSAMPIAAPAPVSTGAPGTSTAHEMSGGESASVSEHLSPRGSADGDDEMMFDYPNGMVGDKEKNSRRSSSYKCGRCGQPKRGHTCAFKKELPWVTHPALMMRHGAQLPPGAMLMYQTPDGQMAMVPQQMPPQQVPQPPQPAVQAVQAVPAVAPQRKVVTATASNRVVTAAPVVVAAASTKPAAAEPDLNNVSMSASASVDGGEASA